MTAKRNFAATNKDGNRVGKFSGQSPVKAAEKAARRLIEDPADSEDEAKESRELLRLRETNQDKVNVYLVWAWTTESPEEAPEYLGDEIVDVGLDKIK